MGETVGFSVPAVTGAALVALDAPFWLFVPVVLASGAVEGAVLGFAQAFVWLIQAIPRRPRDITPRRRDARQRRA